MRNFITTYLSKMAAKAWYKDWFNSPYYHLLYNNRDDDEAQAFLERLITYLQPKPNTKMLDVACGKGRHSKALAEMGFDVTGIDLSQSSIEEAKLDETEKPSLLPTRYAVAFLDKLLRYCL